MQETLSKRLLFLAAAAIVMMATCPTNGGRLRFKSFKLIT